MTTDVLTRGPLLELDTRLQGLERAVSFRPRRPAPTRDFGVSALAPGGDWVSVEQPALEAELLLALNVERVKAGRVPLALNQHVQASIGFYMLESAEFSFLSHDSPDVGDSRWPAMPWSARLQLFGSPASAALGENLAYGFTDVASVVSAWMSDVGHRANVLSAAWVGVGCGVARWPGNGQPQTHPDGTPNDAYRGPLLFWGNDFTSERATPPPPPPAGAIVKDAIWRNKMAPAQRVQITRTVAPGDAKVYYHVLRSGLDRHMLVSAFLLNFEPAP